MPFRQPVKTKGVAAVVAGPWARYPAARPAATAAPSPQGRPPLPPAFANVGPWSVCTVQFCEIDKRRRSLLNSVQCDSLSCPVNPTTGIASCNLTHFLPQELTVTGNGTAVKADGTRKSQSTPAPLPTFSIPLFP